MILGHCVSFEQDVGDLTLVLPRSIESIQENLRVFFIGNNTHSQTKVPLVNSIRRGLVTRALGFLKAHNYCYTDVSINTDIFNEDSKEFNIHTIQNQSLQDMLGSIEDHNNHDFKVMDTEVQSKIQAGDMELDRSEMQTSGLMTVNLSDYGLENIVLKASLNTWINLFKQGELYASRHQGEPKNTFDELAWLPAMYPLLFPIGVTGPDCGHRHIPVSLEQYVKHQLSIADNRFATHDTFMFSMYNIIQRRNVAKSLRFAIRGRELFQITQADLQESLQQLVSGEDMQNAQVKKLFNKVLFLQTIYIKD